MEPLKRKRNSSNNFCAELDLKTADVKKFENRIKDLSLKCSRNLIEVSSLIPLMKGLQAEFENIDLDEGLTEGQMFLCERSKIMEEIFSKYKQLCSQVKCYFNAFKTLNYSNLNILYDLTLYDSKNSLWIFDMSTRIRKSQLLDFPSDVKMSCNTCLVHLPSYKLFCYDYSSFAVTAIIDLINFDVKIVSTKGKRFNEAWMIHYKTCIYLFGYFFNGASFWSVVGKFDLDRNRWLNIVQPAQKIAFTTCVEFNGKILSIGKNMKRIYQYDLVTESYSTLWRSLDRLESCRVMFKLNERAYIIGKNCIIESGVLNENNWSMITDWNYGINFSFNMVKEYDGQVFVGGLYQGWLICYKFNPRNKRFERIETLCENYN